MPVAPVSSTVIQLAVRNPATQHILRLREEFVLPSDQQPHHLPLRNGNADRPQLLHQPGHRDLPLVVLRQHETAQLRPEMARHTRWQRRNHRPSIRRNPALAAIADSPNPQHNILHHEILVSLEAGTRRDLQRKHPPCQ